MAASLCRPSATSSRFLPGPVLHQACERLRVQARSTHERAVKFLLRHQPFNIVRLDAPAVQNLQRGRMAGGELLRRTLTHELMRCRSDLRCSRAASANGPDRFVSYQNTGEFLGGQRAHAAHELRLNNFFGVASLAIGKHFTDAHNGRKSRSESGFGLLEDGFVGLAEELAPLRVADDGIAASRFHQHAGGNLPGVGAFLLPEHILRGNLDGGALGGLDGGGYIRKGRSDNDVAVFHSRHQRKKRGKKRPRLRLILVHLPVAGDYPAAFYGAHLSVSASTPGSLRPPRNSSEAPPPVEMCEICFATPDWCTAATESPPPIMDMAPAVVAAATALAISSVPLANAGISNTPIGPFHTMVLDFAISAL